MSLSFRHRTGLLLAGLMMGAPLLAAGIARAGTFSITFSGVPLIGLSTLSCSSTPSQATLVVEPGTVVDFVNRTGKTSTLWAGNAQKDLPDRSLVPVTFQQGPASIVVQMVPKCSLDLGRHISMTVTVEPPRSGGGTHSDSGGEGVSKHTAGSTPTPKSSPSAVAPAGGEPTTPPGDIDPLPAAPGATNAAQPVFGSPVGPTAPRSASGLLTLIATVGVVGVSVAAIRAILGQRVTKSSAA